jgi:flagellar hook-length control protein FliK
VKAEAPQAPVVGSEKVAKKGQNRKTPGPGHSAARGRGLDKGSVLFQHLLSARAAGKNTVARLIPETEGLKGSPALAGLLKVPQGARIPVELPLGSIVSEAAGKQEKEDAAHKAARPKTTVVHLPTGQVPGQAEAHLKAPGSGKEKKPDTSELSKDPVTEARTQASRAEPLIRVVDLRRVDKARGSSATADPQKDAQKPESPASPGKDASTVITVKPGATREAFAETPPKPVAPASANGQTPLERLREMAGSELVRASNLVLKDGGGEIRLVLKPESLGSVRIRMNVVDNSIEGRIIVDSAAVKHVFDGSVDALRRALTAEGFQMGSLQVSVGGQNTDADERRRQEQATAVRKIAVQGFERNVPGVENVSLGDLFVNLFV